MAYLMSIGSSTLDLDFDLWDFLNCWTLCLSANWIWYGLFISLSVDSSYIYDYFDTKIASKLESIFLRLFALELSFIDFSELKIVSKEGVLFNRDLSEPRSKI